MVVVLALFLGVDPGLDRRTAIGERRHQHRSGRERGDAHEIVAHAVKTAIAQGVDLSGLTLEALQQFDARIEADVFDVLSLRGSLTARNVLGGTAPAQVRLQIARHQARLG